ALHQPANVAAIDLVHLRMLAWVAVEPEVGRVDRLLIHPAEDLGPEVLHPVGVQVHGSELPKRLDVHDAGHEAVVARHGVPDHGTLIVDDVGVATRDVEWVLHSRVHVDRPDVRADHIDVVEVCVSTVLEQPGTAEVSTGLSHRYRLARTVDDLRTVEGECADRLRILAVAAADGAEIADVVGAQHRVERVDAVTEQLDPAVEDVVRRTGTLTAPEMVLRRAMHDLAPRREDEEGVEEAIRHHLWPACL